MQEYEGIISRVASLTLRIISKIQVIQVYTPRSSNEDEEIIELYKDIVRIMENNKSHYKIIISDFNAKEQNDGGTVGTWVLLPEMRERLSWCSLQHKKPKK
jgi:hypothetical protein